MPEPAEPPITSPQEQVEEPKRTKFGLGEINGSDSSLSEARRVHQNGDATQMRTILRESGGQVTSLSRKDDENGLKWNGGVTVAVEDLCYGVRPRSMTKRYFSERTELLHGVNFIGRPGQVSAILGPSGCGKTTLLNVLSGRARGKITRGRICYNGMVCDPGRLKGAVALLNANDRLLAYLNVRETLMFTAYLRMQNSTKAEREARIDQILEDLALVHAQDTMVGGAWKKGLSSGEMRRCSIAMELMGDPSVLLLDEPTSGLDAVLAYEVISVLKKLASKGKTIICILHQPRSSVCRLLDNVSLMCKGHLIFQGSMPEAHSHFLGAMGRDISKQGNYADDLLDIANGIEEELPARTEVSSHDTGDAHAGDLKPVKTDMCRSSEAVWQEAKASWNSSTLAEQQRSEIAREFENRREVPNVGVGRNFICRFLNEVYGVSYRTFRNSWNNPMALLISLLVQASMGVFLGFIFFRLPYKFLPSVKPMYIGDSNSPPMQLLETPLLKFITEGLDGQGTNPLLDMITKGVDGKGSDPLRLLLSSGDPTSLSPVEDSHVIPYRFANMMPCAFKRLGLDYTNWYIDTHNLTDYYPNWKHDRVTNPAAGASGSAGRKSTFTSDGEGGVRLDHPIYKDILRTSGYGEPAPGTSLDTGKYFVFGEYNAPSTVKSMIQSLAFFDYIFYNLPWAEAHHYCSTFFLSSYIPCFGCHGEIGAFLDASSECTDIPEQPFNIMRPCTSELPPDEAKTSITVFDENGDFKRTPYGNVIYPRTIPPRREPKLSEYGSAPARRLQVQTKPAKRRKLQISGLMGSGLDLSTFLPPTLLGLADAGERYLAAVRECSHPVCRKIAETFDEYATGDRKDPTSTTITDYAAVVGAVLNIAGALFFSITALGFGAYDGLTALCQERPLINRELKNGTYKPVSYFLGRTLGDFVFHLIPAFCMIIPFYLIIDVDKGPSGLWFAKYLLICLIMTTTAYGFSYCVSALSPSMEVAVIAAPLALVVLVCCSGFFVRDSAVPEQMTWLKYLSFYRWGFFALCLNQFPPEQDYWGVPNSFNLALIGVNETSLAKCCGIMVLLGIGFRIVATCGLKFCHRRIGIES